MIPGHLFEWDPSSQNQEQVETGMENPSSNAKPAVERSIASGMEAKVEPTSKIEQFSATQLGNLRTALMSFAIDSWQAADVLSTFLTGRGYGISPQGARDAIAQIEPWIACRKSWSE